MKSVCKFLFFCLLVIFSQISFAQRLTYKVSFPNPESHIYHVEVQASDWETNELVFKMPNWMPGYYQKMNYAQSVQNLKATDSKGNEIAAKKANDNSWSVSLQNTTEIVLSYDIQTTRQFVATSYVDEQRAYLIPENSFMYVDGFLDLPATVVVDKGSQWMNVATGLKLEEENVYSAVNFDILYDCPILIGNLEELPSFSVQGIKHRFIGYKMGDFDKALFMQNLKKVVESAVNIIGDIPYDEYTLIGIGPGQGGIEHLNNTTVSFNGNGLDNPRAMNTVLNFLAHEYFHHYNVKRIRPFELGPFDYDAGSRTNLLWVSEGLSVYYEYLVVKRAGLADEKTLFSDFEGNLNTVENNPGRHFQSIEQASYNTWKDGPFGNSGEEKGKTISYYTKGPLIGLLMDFGIRHVTQNEKSLDDAMRLVYYKYYKDLGRGFTDAEFQQACEEVAGQPLTELFEYVNTTKDLDYEKYLGYAGLKLTEEKLGEGKGYRFHIERKSEMNDLEKQILQSWLTGK